MVHLYLDRLDAAVIAPSSHFFCVEATISSVFPQYVTPFPEKLFSVQLQLLWIADEMFDHWLREH